MSEMLAKKLEEADRLLRRGEFESARGAYVALLGYAAGPEAETLRARIASVDELIGPVGGAAPLPPPPPSAGPTPQQRAEEAVNQGRINDAIDLYAGIMASQPDDLLAKERMTELLAMKTKTMRARLSSASIPRVLTAQDSLNANIAGEHESGPLGKALDGAKSKPLPPTPTSVQVGEDTFDVEMDVEINSTPGMQVPPAAPPPPRPAPPQDNLLLGEVPRTPVPVSSAVVALPSAHPHAAAPSANVAAMPPPVAAPFAPPKPVVAAPAKPASPAPLPADPVAMLRELLARVKTNRRAPTRLTPFAE